jgi:hypothetical protein
MTTNDRRRELKAAYREALPEAGVYRILNSANGKSLIGSTTNLKNIQNKLAFGKSQNSVSVLDHRLRADARITGMDALSIEVLERLDVTPETTDEQIRSDLAVLEQLWREKLDDGSLY